MDHSRHRLLTPPKGHFFLLGPRGTGKTLWTQQVFLDALRIDLLDPETFRVFAAGTERLRDVIAAHPEVKTVVIDEIQKLPTLLEGVHLLISEQVKYQFVLTGSSARKLRHGNVNLLGGRAVMRTMHPYVAKELGADFDLDEHLKTGLVPVVVESQNRHERCERFLCQTENS